MSSLEFPLTSTRAVESWAGDTRGWRYLAQRLNRDGSQGIWLDNELPLSDVQFTEVLSGPTQITAKIEPELKRMIAADGDPLLDEWATAIYVEADGIIRAGAIVVSTTKSGKTYDLDCTGFTSFAKGIPYAGNVAFTYTDPTEIIRHIWDHIQSQPASNIGLQIDRTTFTSATVGTSAAASPVVNAATVIRDRLRSADPVSEDWTWQGAPELVGQYNDALIDAYGGNPTDRVASTAWLTEYIDARTPVTDDTTPSTQRDDPYELNWWSTHDLGREIDTLAQNGPFDYRETHEWDATKTGVIHRLDFGTPLFGTRRDDLRFVLGENIQVMPTVERDGEDYANHIIVLGAGEGSAMVRAEARVEDGRLRRPKIIEAKSLTSTNEAERLARNQLALYSQLTTISQVVVRDSPSTPIGSWQVGDEIRLIADTDWESLDLWFQVQSMTFTPDQPDIVTMTLARSGHTATLPTSVDRLAVQIAAIRNEVRDLARSPQLTNSSIDDGSLETRVDGSTSVVIGQQWDGTNTVAQVTGKNPPRPAGITGETTMGGIIARWDGTFDENQTGFTRPIVAPMDWAGLTFEVSNAPGFPDNPAATKRYDMSSAAGGHVTVSWAPAGTALYVRARARTGAGKYSDWSTAAGPVESGLVGLADLAFQIADYVSGTTIHWGPFEPAAEDIGGVGDLWLKEIDEGPPPEYETWRWNGATWIRLQDQGVTQALADAITAQQAAEAAQTTADLKTRHFSQATPPTGLLAKDKGSIWTDTDGGNARYTWTNEVTTTTVRRNIALNPSFEADTAATIAPGRGPLLWDRFDTGDTGGAVWTIATGGIGGGKYARAVSPAMAPTAEFGLIHEVPVAGLVGSLVRISSRVWVTAADTTKPVQMYIDWLNASGGVVSSARTTGVGTAGTAAAPQVLVLPTLTALYTIPVGAVTMRVWIMRASSAVAQVNGLPASTTTLTNADVNIDQVLIDVDPPSGQGASYFDGSTAAESSWEATPLLSSSRMFSTTTTTSGTYDWRPALLRSGAIQPKSLVASSVVATGTVSAALLESIMVLASVIIAGDPNGDHARMTPQGFFVYTHDPVDGVPNEVIRMGTSSNDVLGITNEAGALVAAINEDGVGTFQDVSVANSLRVQGRTLEAWLGDLSQQTPGSFSGNVPVVAAGYYGPIQLETGVAEVNGYLYAGREYEIRVRWTGVILGDDGVETRSYVRYTGPDAPGSNSAPAPGYANTYVDHWLHTFHWQGRWETFENTCRFQASQTGRHRFLLSVERGALGRIENTNADVYIVPQHKVTMAITDIGPIRPVTGQITQGGRAFNLQPPPPPPPPPPQNYFVELAPAGYTSYRGNGTVRPAGDGVVQGPDPTGYNGIGKGHWWFSIPNITGTITNMEMYIHAEHWYYGDGGQIVNNLTLVGQGGPNYPQPKGDWVHTGGPGWWPRGAGRNFQLPGDWWEHFTTHPPGGQRADGIRVGPTANYLREYGRFHGSGARLKIWFTQ